MFKIVAFGPEIYEFYYERYFYIFLNNLASCSIKFNILYLNIQFLHSIVYRIFAVNTSFLIHD